MNLLAVRMSAMGDVALTLPAIRSVLDHYPEVHIAIVTKKQFLPFFENIDRLTPVHADVEGKHKGIGGLYRLYKEIKQQYKPDAVLDLHDVLRSHILSFYFKNTGTPVFRINKGRKEKKQLTAKKDKQFRPLTPTVTRYLNVFKEAGFAAGLAEYGNWFSRPVLPASFLRQNNLLPKKTSRIGIAPFARHPEKMWPLTKMEQVIASLDRGNNSILLFGGGEKEIAVFNQFKEKYKRVIVAAGALTLSEELGVISQLDIMISMDSANMHLAALSGIPVVSIWGATHTYAGFGPMGDNEKLVVQVPFNQLTCRPCSVFGNKPCWRGDHACMEWIDPEKVLEKVQAALDVSGGTPTGP